MLSENKNKRKKTPQCVVLQPEHTAGLRAIFRMEPKPRLLSSQSPRGTSAEHRCDLAQLLTAAMGGGEKNLPCRKGLFILIFHRVHLVCTTQRASFFFEVAAILRTPPGWASRLRSSSLIKPWGTSAARLWIGGCYRSRLHQSEIAPLSTVVRLPGTGLGMMNALLGRRQSQGSKAGAGIRRWLDLAPTPLETVARSSGRG